jgi:hypothetical protein
MLFTAASAMSFTNASAHSGFPFAFQQLAPFEGQIGAGKLQVL